MKKTTIGVFLLGLVVLFAFGLDFFSAMRSYGKLRTNTRSPLMQAIQIETKERKFLEEVRDSWFLRGSIWPDDEMAEMCESVGFRPNTAGMVALYTHEVPPFSIFDKERNLKEAGRAGALSALKPRTTDHNIYWAKGIAYMIVCEDVLDCYEDTKNGIKRTIDTRKPPRTTSTDSHPVFRKRLGQSSR